MTRTNIDCLALIFQQGGRLIRILDCQCYVDETHGHLRSRHVESFMAIFYDFPYYAQYVPKSEILTASKSLRIVLKDPNGMNVKDALVNLHTPESESFPNEWLGNYQIIEGELYTPDGDMVKTDLSGFDAFQELNTCPDCGGDGYQEVGPTCLKPAWDCCGGCYEKHECELCSGTGKILNL